MNYRSAYFFLLQIACSALAYGQITFDQNQEFRVYSVSSSVSVPVRFQATVPNGTVSSVTATINGTNYSSVALGGGIYEAQWTSSSFGSFPVYATVNGSNGYLNNTVTAQIKIIELAACPVPDWNAQTQFNGGDVCSYLGTLYTANYWTQGNQPDVSDSWQNSGVCCSQNYQSVDCSALADWDIQTIYAAAGAETEVQYNGIAYHANYWTQGNVPTSGGPWSFVGVCEVLNESPTIQSPEMGQVFIQSNITSIDLTAQIADADGSIIDAAFVVNGVNLGTLNENLGTYSISWNPPAYGIFSFQIIAMDDELATDTLTGTFQVASSQPPVISNILPLNSSSINTVYQLNSDIIPISADAIDPDGTITDLTFTINGSTFPYSSVNLNNYQLDWQPTIYGQQTVIITATDNLGTTSIVELELFLENPLFETLNTTALPLQLNANIGYDKTFDLGETIQNMIIRNPDLINVSFSGNEFTISPNRTGRTGLKIVTSNSTYYMGVRINNCDGTPPGMPDYASIGFKSEDTEGDLAFWEDMDTDQTNKNMDVRYIYINGGPAVSGNYNSWRDSTRTLGYCENSLKYGLIPCFVYYNIPDGGESFTTDLEHAQDVAYMTEYFQDLNAFLGHCTSILEDELFMIVLEPDFLGYMQQLGVIHLGTNDPDQIVTCVNGSQIATGAGTIHTLVDRINETIDQHRQQGANLIYGWQLNLWSAGQNGGLGLMRRTDPGDQGWNAGRSLIQQAATSTVNYGMNSGILSHSADFVSIDKYGLDAEGYSPAGVTGNPWWFSHDHWDNYMMYAQTMHQFSGSDIVLWQLPVGRINGSDYVSAYTGAPYANLPNTSNQYEDSSVDYFFGDTFDENDLTRFNHFTNNLAQDTGLNVIGSTIRWRQHIQDFPERGIIHAMFGAGVGWSTDGIGNPAEDEYFSIQKIQNYYNEIAFLPTAPFTSTPLTYGLYQGITDLTQEITGATNFVGNGCSSQGMFNPQEAGLGTHHITFVNNLNGCYDYHVQQIAVTDVTVDVFEVDKKHALMLHPNPTQNELTVLFAEQVKHGQIQVMDVHGKLLETHQIQETTTHQLNVTDYPAGIYLLHLITKERSQTVRFVKG